MKNKHTCPLKEWSMLTGKEKKIYNSILDSFPATAHLSAMDGAIQGGVKFHFIPS